MSAAPLAIVAPVIATLFVLRRTPARDLGSAVCACAAVGVGIGLSSLSWWLLTQVPGLSHSTLTRIDVALWTLVLLGALAIPRRGRMASAAHESRRGPVAPAAALLVLLPVAALAVVVFGATSYVVPHGEWDAWAIWNVRARAMYFSAPDVLNLAHADYPALWPSTVARAWTTIGSDTVVVPVALAATFGAGVVLLAGASIRQRWSTTAGLVAAAFVLASPDFVLWTTSQGTDVPLSFYILLTFVFGSAAMTRPQGARDAWILSGLSAGLAAWTKNEGLAFVTVLIVVVIIRSVLARRTAARWLPPLAIAAGAAPVLIVLVAFKLQVEPVNDIVSALTIDRLTTLVTLERVGTVLTSMAREAWFGGAALVGVLPVLGLFVATTGMPGRHDAGAGVALAVLGAMVIVYALVYVMTPHDLDWHLRTSLDRVLLQLLPSAVWAGMVLAGPAATDARDLYAASGE